MTKKINKTEQPKNHKYCFEPNIWSNLHLVNFDMLIEKVKIFTLIV